MHNNVPIGSCRRSAYKLPGQRVLLRCGCRVVRIIGAPPAHEDPLASLWPGHPSPAFRSVDYCISTQSLVSERTFIPPGA